MPCILLMVNTMWSFGLISSLLTISFILKELRVMHWIVQLISIWFYGKTMFTFMFSNVHWMHLIRLYTIQTFWKLQNLFQKGDKEEKNYFSHVVDCLYSLGLKLVTPNVDHHHTIYFNLNYSIFFTQICSL
jgi:hypothetical protein